MRELRRIGCGGDRAASVKMDAGGDVELGAVGAAGQVGWRGGLIPWLGMSAGAGPSHWREWPLAPALASLSTSSFWWMPAWPGTQNKLTAVESRRSLNLSAIVEMRWRFEFGFHLPSVIFSA